MTALYFTLYNTAIDCRYFFLTEMVLEVLYFRLITLLNGYKNLLMPYVLYKLQ